MRKYIPFTEEQKHQAASVDLEEFLRLRGETLIPSGREKRLSSDHSVTVRGNEWFDHETQQGGGPVSFVQTFLHLSYPEAVQLLLDGEHGRIFPAAKEGQQEPTKPFALPVKNRDMRRVFAYLAKSRCIDREIIAHFARLGTIYEDAQYHNAVFAGKDERGIFRHAHKRSTNSQGKVFRLNVEGSDPRYSFHHIGTDGQLFVFEAPIDLLSYLTLHPEGWQEHSYVSCCGTSAIPVLKTLERMKDASEVFLCLDNDKGGHQASFRMAEQIAEQFGIASDRLIPTRKDWNDDLCALRQEQAMAKGMVMV